MSEIKTNLNFNLESFSTFNPNSNSATTAPVLQAHDFSQFMTLDLENTDSNSSAEVVKFNTTLNPLSDVSFEDEVTTTSSNSSVSSIQSNSSSSSNTSLGNISSNSSFDGYTGGRQKIGTNGTIDKGSIDFTRISATSEAAKNGEFINPDSIHSEYWGDSGELTYEVREDGTVLISENGIPLGFTDLQGIANNIKTSYSVSGDNTYTGGNYS